MSHTRACPLHQSLCECEIRYPGTFNHFLFLYPTLPLHFFCLFVSVSVCLSLSFTQIHTPYTLINTHTYTDGHASLSLFVSFHAHALSRDLVQHSLWNQQVLCDYQCKCVCERVFMSTVPITFDLGQRTSYLSVVRNSLLYEFDVRHEKVCCCHILVFT